MVEATRLTLSRFLLLTLLLAVGAGCRDKGSERWACEFITYSNNVVAVYWSGEFVVDRASFLNRIGGHNHAFEVTRRRYLLSQINIENREFIERTLTANEFEKAGTTKTNCMAEFAAETFPAETRIMDGDCQNGHVLLGRMRYARAILVGNGGTNELEFSPYTSGKGAVNEDGTCVFLTPNSGSGREYGGEAEFAVYRDRGWWVSKLVGRMPGVDESEFSRTSSVPALVEAVVTK